MPHDDKWKSFNDDLDTKEHAVDNKMLLLNWIEEIRFITFSQLLQTGELDSNFVKKIFQGYFILFSLYLSG
uniref:Uncharacterized protein n=1 Tax=Meloidogyne enterolobii TaxID=390850 RepID=A0A6V7XHR4_MELEN|nr:unnamed protein product [Meloidogyne enterolobii]